MQPTPSSPPPAKKPRKIKWEYIVPIIAALILAVSGIISAIINKQQSQTLIPTSTAVLSTTTPSITASSSPTAANTSTVATPTSVVQFTNQLFCNNPTGTKWIIKTPTVSCSNGVLLMQQDTKLPDYAQVNLTTVSGSPLNLTQFHMQVQANFIGNPNDLILGNTVAACYIQIPRTPQNIVGYVFEFYPNSNHTDTFTGPSWDIESINLKGINADGTTLITHGSVASGASKVITAATMTLTIQGQEVTFSIGGIQETTFLLDSTPIAFGLVVGEQHTGGASSEVQFSQFTLS